MPSTSESEHEKTTRLEELSKDMLKMLKEGSAHDVKIILDDGELLANKDVLNARCEYFAATFRWNNKNNNEESEEIRIEGCSKKVMERIIEFLFTGVLKFKDLDMHSSMSLIDQIRKLVLGEDLEKSVEEFLIDNLLLPLDGYPLGADLPFEVQDDVLTSYQYAYNLNLKEIQSKYATIIALIICCSENLLEEVKQKVVDLPVALFKDILFYCHLQVERSSYLNLNPRQMNKRIFQFVASWYEKNKDGCSKADKDEMMQLIKLDKFLLSDLIKIVKPSGLFPDEKVDEMMLAHAEEVDKFFLGLDGEK